MTGWGGGGEGQEWGAGKRKKTIRHKKSVDPEAGRGRGNKCEQMNMSA